MLEIVHCTTDQHKADLRELLLEFVALADKINETDKIENPPTFADFEKEFANLPDKFAPEFGGGFYIAYVDDKAAGCVAMRKENETTAELKRMFVRPGFRGQKIGWKLVQHLIAKAREFKYKKVMLDSHISMKKAHSIYEGCGFKPVPPWKNFPEDLIPIVVFMELTL